MNFIHRLIQRLRKTIYRPIPDDLWVDLLESGASASEIQWHFNQRDGFDDRVMRLTKDQRRQYALYTTRFSSRLALWWILVQLQHQRTQRRTLESALAYPMLLLGLAFGMIGLLSNVMYPRINTLFAEESHIDTLLSWTIGLNILEVIYIGLLCLITLIACIPPRTRKRFLTKHFHHPLLSGLRLIIRHRFMSVLIQALAKGMSIHDLLFILGHGTDNLLGYVANQVNADLLRGSPLSEALIHIDPNLKHMVVFHDNDRPLDAQLKRYAALQALRFQSMVKRLRSGFLAWAYVSFGIIMISAYQMMFEPIRRLEQWL